MATYTHRVLTSSRYEWEVPAAEPWGATVAEIDKALAAAQATYRDIKGLSPDESLTDDAIRFHVTDDAIVLTFTHDKPAGGAA